MAYLEVDDVIDERSVEEELRGPQLEVHADVVRGQTIGAEVVPSHRLRGEDRRVGHTARLHRNRQQNGTAYSGDV